MGLREDVKYMLNKDWEPKVPSQEVMQKQAVAQIKRGRSTGSVSMDVKAIKKLSDSKIAGFDKIKKEDDGWDR